MSKKFKLSLIIGTICLLFLVAIFGGFFIYKKSSVIPGYSMVYLVSGQAYVGKLSLFPRMELKDSYLFELVSDTEDKTKANFQLSPLDEAVWSPKTIYLNPKNVAFYGPIKETSKIGQALKEKSK